MKRGLTRKTRGDSVKSKEKKGEEFEHDVTDEETEALLETLDETPEYETLSIEDANQLVLDNRVWAEGVARAVARAWNLDWDLDGLDGAAMEALIFCARRFNPERGIPFKGYARRRIHEAATEAARRCRGWKRNAYASKKDGSKPRGRSQEVAIGLLNVYPELRSGSMFGGDEGGEIRSNVRQLLMSATLIASTDSLDEPSAEEILDLKTILNIITTLELIHQLIIWKVYWEGLSLRGLAAAWETDGLNVIREHKVLVAHLHKCISSKNGRSLQRPKIRPGLRTLAAELNKDPDTLSPFAKFKEKLLESSA